MSSLSYQNFWYASHATPLPDILNTSIIHFYNKPSATNIGLLMGPSTVFPATNSTLPSPNS